MERLSGLTDPIQDNCIWGYVLPDRCRYSKHRGCPCGAYPPLTERLTMEDNTSTINKQYRVLWFGPDADHHRKEAVLHRQDITDAAAWVLVNVPTGATFLEIELVE